MQLLGQKLKEIKQQFVTSPIKSNWQVVVTQPNKISLIFTAHYKIFVLQILCTVNLLKIPESTRFAKKV